MTKSKMFFCFGLGFMCGYVVRVLIDAPVDLGSTEPIEIRLPPIDAGVEDASVQAGPAVTPVAVVEVVDAKSDCIATGQCISGKHDRHRDI